jgi:hypothetical protein
MLKKKQWTYEEKKIGALTELGWTGWADWTDWTVWLR